MILAKLVTLAPLQGEHQEGRSGAVEAGEQGTACVSARVAPAHARLDAEHCHPSRGQSVHPRQSLGGTASAPFQRGGNRRSRKSGL